MNRNFFVRVLLICLLAAGFFSSAYSEPQTLMMATTTSTDNTGLLDYLAPLFTKDTGIDLKWTAVGTGKALELGKNCDVDVLLVHAPDAEKQYVAEGFGVNRREIMYNDFVIIGPSADPAAIKGKSVLETLKRVQKGAHPFVSRGDNSGTHKMEQSLWKLSGLNTPEKENFYIQTGQGMMATLTIAEEKKGYTLTDRGTYIKYEDKMGGNPQLKILVEGDDMLKNQYSVIEINPVNCPKTRSEQAKVFANWIAGEKAQKWIGDFKLLNKQLFIPNAK
ncbi:MAG: substrate-binding domain-containing protein [Proteobacteria bacterium]|nr:substrate-binding domain-containing protein [Pseudomonadota bacterium]